MPDADQHLYERAYAAIDGLLAPPGVVLYLTASAEELLRRVRNRGLSSEAWVDLAMIERVSVLYDEWIATELATTIVERVEGIWRSVPWLPGR